MPTRTRSRSTSTDAFVKLLPRLGGGFFCLFPAETSVPFAAKSLTRFAFCMFYSVVNVRRACRIRSKRVLLCRALHRTRSIVVLSSYLPALAAFLHVLRGLLRSHRRLFFIFPPFAIRRVVVRGCRRMPPCRLRLCVAICLAAALLSSSSCLHSFPPFFGIKRARSLSGPRSAFAQALIIPAYRSSLFRTEICSSARGWNATA